ncbi:MAG: DUF5682 family protein [Myxococcota bacterium]
MTAERMASGDVHVFGIRHLSPAGAWHLVQFLDAVDPDAVLVEGMADLVELVPDIVRSDAQPPLAALAYTSTFPIRTMISPLAEYSPEYQALRWATHHDRRIELIDLPSEVFLALDAVAPMHEGVGEEAEAKVSIYERLAASMDESDYDTYWERSFEHNTATDSYRQAACALGAGLRALEEDTPQWRAENLVREAYMRRRIAAVIEAGVDPKKIVAVVGAFHAPVLGADHPAMTDEEFEQLPRRESRLTLMPYSYFRLSSQSGYGAGNHAPAYFQLMWKALDAGDLSMLPARYLTHVVRQLRTSGTHRSTAEVIEGVRLAETLSALKGGQAPTLSDLRDAAITLIGHGEASVVQEALARIDVGTAVGRLPKGVSQTSIQADFDRLLRALKLDKYRKSVKQDLVLDLRENRHAKTEEAAFLDLRRSSFFHRLRVLGVSFATPVQIEQASATWKEHWHLQWTPESEIELVEAVLLGETIELAVGYKFKTTLDTTTSIAAAAQIVRDACQCGLLEAMEVARSRMQALSTEKSEFRAVASAAHMLGTVVRYGDVRNFDTSPLKPLIADLFVQGALALFATAICDDEGARAAIAGMDALNQVNLEYHELVDEPLWLGELAHLSDADDRNPLMSGYACAILLERNMISNEALNREVSRRVSPGIPADLGAGWFEGVSMRNRYALIARQVLWAQLGDYVASLDEEQFRRAVVFLRRAFGGFSPQQKRQIAENLAEHWGVSPEQATEVLDEQLSDEEEAALSELNEFDFSDL